MWFCKIKIVFYGIIVGEDVFNCNRFNENNNVFKHLDFSKNNESYLT